MPASSVSLIHRRRYAGCYLLRRGRDNITPAHIGTVGNKLAGVRAREATTLHPDSSLFVSLTTVQRLIHLQTLASWDDRWKRSKSGGALRYIDKSPLSLQTPYPMSDL
ncbi:hypothetical protein B0H14DRAFT_3429716 [Mycena olivaceomarginata]|nr:hypothetical protein B0H14DRAFT_3429716 [Mycena olivaceomarginata]